jgi:hypothetical protein
MGLLWITEQICAWLVQVGFPPLGWRNHGSWLGATFCRFFGSFWTVSVRIGAFAQYDVLYGLIYRIFLVFLGLFPVGFGLLG